MRGVLKLYLDVLERRPLPTKIVSGVVIFSTADVLAQLYEQYMITKDRTTMLDIAARQEVNVGLWHNFEWDFPRTCRMGAFGGIVNIWIHHWWGFLEPKIERIFEYKSHRFKNAFVKVIVDQSIGSPVFNAIFFASQAALQGHSPTEIREAVAERLPIQLARHYQVWPFVHIFNFSLFPLHQRVIVQNVLTVGWAAYMSRCEQAFDDEVAAAALRTTMIEEVMLGATEEGLRDRPHDAAPASTPEEEGALPTPSNATTRAHSAADKF